jgi:hypothetical protein
MLDQPASKQLGSAGVFLMPKVPALFGALRFGSFGGSNITTTGAIRRRDNASGPGALWRIAFGPSGQKEGILKIGKALGVGTSVVQRVVANLPG